MKFRYILHLGLLIIPCVLCFAQELDTLKTSYHFRGNISVTQNGMSLIPAFSLGKPAAIAELSLGGERLRLRIGFGILA